MCDYSLWACSLILSFAHLKCCITMRILKTNLTWRYKFRNPFKSCQFWISGFSSGIVCDKATEQYFQVLLSVDYPVQGSSSFQSVVGILKWNQFYCSRHLHRIAQNSTIPSDSGKDRQHELSAKIDMFLRYCLFCCFSWHTMKGRRSNLLSC